MMDEQSTSESSDVAPRNEHALPSTMIRGLMLQADGVDVVSLVASNNVPCGASTAAIIMMLLSPVWLRSRGHLFALEKDLNDLT